MAYRSGSIIILIIFDRSALLGKTSSSNPLFLIKKLGKAGSAEIWNSMKSFGGKFQWLYRSEFNHYTYNF